MIVIVFILIRKLSCLQRSVLDRIEKKEIIRRERVLFFLSARFIKASATEFLFPSVEEEGEEYGQTPIGDCVRDVRFHAPVVEGGEDIRFGEHVHDFDCEDEGEEFDGFQIVCEKGGKRHDERLGKDDSCESAERGHAHGDGCFILAVVYGTESAADIFRLVGGII